MNFLAHIYLSGDNELISIGNFAADGVRGKNYESYSDEIQVGILLHRAIDSYTDAHPIFRKSTKRLHKHYGHYSGVIVDIFYDHFLAKNWKMYSDTPLAVYVDNFYQSLKKHMAMLPPRYQHIAPIMIEGNWLLSYASIAGIQSVLNGMNRRTKGISKMNEATRELKAYYQDFEDDFTTFFEALIVFSEQKRLELKQLYKL
ncbi:ACP phosphodiesterase [Winogradskyella sp.]|uniref:acyl carrier protein phosphodiesterase n=1 Tax=Winogradskyella sp. TaxID=1883156 RepID=UPI003BAD8501